MSSSPTRSPPAYVEDVVPTADAVDEDLGALVGPRCVELLDDEVEASGKAAVVGVDGEMEHARR